MAVVCKSVLITGFGSFPGVAINVSGTLAVSLGQAASLKFADWQVKSAILPTEWDQGLLQLRALLAEVRPAVAIHFGVSRLAAGFQIETVARCTAKALADNAGCLPCDEALFGADPVDLMASFPAEAIASRLSALHIPVTISEDAGQYLCNAALYTSLAHGAEHAAGSMRGFVHVPEILSEQTISFPEAIRAGLELLEVCFAALDNSV